MPIVDMSLWRRLVLMELRDIRLYCGVCGVEFGLEPLVAAALSVDGRAERLLDEAATREFTDRHDAIEAASAAMHDAYSSWPDFVAAWAEVIALELDSVGQFFSHELAYEAGQPPGHVEEVGVVLPWPPGLLPGEPHGDDAPPRDGDGGAHRDVLPCAHAQLPLHGVPV
jgi:hypothetical protein